MWRERNEVTIKSIQHLQGIYQCLKTDLTSSLWRALEPNCGLQTTYSGVPFCQKLQASSSWLKVYMQSKSSAYSINYFPFRFHEPFGKYKKKQCILGDSKYFIQIANNQFYLIRRVSSLKQETASQTHRQRYGNGVSNSCRLYLDYNITCKHNHVFIIYCQLEHLLRKKHQIIFKRNMFSVLLI